MDRNELIDRIFAQGNQIRLIGFCLCRLEVVGI